MLIYQGVIGRHFLIDVNGSFSIAMSKIAGGYTMSLRKLSHRVWLRLFSYQVTFATYDELGVSLEMAPEGRPSNTLW